MKRILLSLFLLFLPLVASADLEVHFLDVGHGDSAIIICDGAAMVIDGGDERNSDKLFAVIKDLGITDLQFAVATHPQTDHVGGLTAIFYASTVHALYAPTVEPTNARFEMLLDKAALSDVPVTVPAPGDTVALGGATVTFLTPIKQYKEENDMSIVLRLDYGEHSFLFTGDAGKAVERDLLGAGAAVDVDVLKVAHHGGNSASSSDFLAVVSPTYALISCSSRYDNPDAEVLKAFYAQNSTVLRTDVNGDITARSDGKTLTFTADSYYVANIQTEVFHRSTCSSVAKMKTENMITYFTAEQAEQKGYRPCKNCSP